jgi:20S proteasome subunit beta 6
VQRSGCLYDVQVMGKNMSPELVAVTPGAPVLDGEGRSNLPLERVLAIVTDSFSSATERHIEIGDGLEMYVVAPRQ